MASIQHQIFLGIGSNINAETNIRSAMKCLKTLDSQLTTSKTYQSEAIGFCGPAFLNLVVGMTTSKSLSQLSCCLKNMERHHGRAQAPEKYTSRTLDIDILTFDNVAGIVHGIELPRPEISYNAYVLRPFSELMPQLILPCYRNSLEELWRTFDQASQPLVEMKLLW